MNQMIENCVVDVINNINTPKLGYEAYIDTRITLWAVQQAYGDIQRTLKRNMMYKKKIDSALNKISKSMADYFMEHDPMSTQEEYDLMQEDLCIIWIKKMKETLFGTYGCAQKIVNMAFKYLYCIDYETKKYYEWFRFCHITIDFYILDWMRQNKSVSSKIKLSNSIEWSNLDYEMYMILQGNAVMGIEDTSTFVDCTPIEAEFIIWDAAVIYRVSQDYNMMLQKNENREYMQLDTALTASDLDTYIENIVSNLKENCKQEI